MTVYYPQAVVTLRILWEDFGNKSDPFLKNEYVLEATPKRVTVSINDYKKADTVDLELDYRNFPFDPRTIRACGITVQIQDMGKAYDDKGPVQIAPKFSGEFSDSSNAVFIGFADTDSITFNDSSRTVKLEGRDYTALLIDTPFSNKNTNRPLSLAAPLEAIFQQLLLDNPATKNIALDNRGAGTLPTLAKLAPDFNVFASERSQKKDESYWDVIQDLAAKAGIIAYIELDRLVLTKPRTLYDETKLKQFVWGVNLSSLSFRRKLGRVKNFNVIVRSTVIESKSKEPLTAKIPEECTAEFSQRTGIPRRKVAIEQLGPKGEQLAPKDAPYLAFRLGNIADKNHLIQVGEKIYEELSRQEIEGELETKDMLVPEGNPNAGVSPTLTPVEFDVTKIRNGTPIDIRIVQDDLAEIAKESNVDKRRQFLINRAYNAKVAQALAQVLGKLNTPFYTKAAEFTLDVDQGFAMKLEFINFITLSKDLIK